MYDEDGQPAGGAANKLTTFLGCLARNGEFFPISTPLWTDMSENCINNAWDEIQVIILSFCQSFNPFFNMMKLFSKLIVFCRNDLPPITRMLKRKL